MSQALVRWSAVSAGVVALTVVLDRVGAPTPPLFAGFAAGIAFALIARWHLDLPRPATVLSQAVIGVTVGGYLHSSTLSEVASNGVAVLLVCVTTLALSVVFGLLLSKLRPVDQATSSFGMIAGGAAGIISISRELGADERLVAVLQYTRVLIIVALTPLVATVGFGIESSPHSPAGGGTGWLTGIGLVALCTAIGLPLARLVRLPAGGLLGPMLVAAVFALSGTSLTLGASEPVVLVAFALVGLEVGLRFTPASLRQAGALLPAAVAMILALLAACAALGIVLASIANVSRLDGYLATTPGGLSAVLALSVGSRTNTTFILSVQLIRTFVMLLAAPPLARWIARRWGRDLSERPEPRPL
ncbi:MAG TPA: AbrB family transcriptional regulator [Gaiella sp.]